MKFPTKNPFWRRPLFWVIILGAGIRVLYLMIYYSDPQWGQLVVDSLFHHRWATAIGSGEILGKEPFFRAPLYIYIIGGLYGLLGPSLWAARIFGHLAGLLSIYVTYRLTEKLFGSKAAIIAAIIHALYPIAIYFEGELLVDSLLMLLIETSLLVFLIALERRSKRVLFWGGILIGLAAITKAIVLALIPLFLVMLFLTYRDFKTTLGAGLLFLAAVIIPIAPVTARNYFTGGDWVPIASSGGINFFIGNNESANGYSASLPPPLRNSWVIQDIEYLAEKETGREMKPSEISDFYYDKGWAWIKGHPVDFILLYLKKLHIGFNNLEISNNRNINLFFRGNLILKSIPLNFALIFALTFFTVVSLTIGKGWNYPRLFILSYMIIFMLILAFFFINARFRLPVLPLMFAFGAWAASEIFDGIRKFKIDKAGGIALTLALAVFFYSRVSLPEVSPDDIKSGLFNQANYYLNHGDYARAAELYQRIIKENPHYPDVNLNLGAAFLKMGQTETAEKYFLQELKSHPRQARAYSNLASIYYLKKDFLRALELVERALKERPYLLEAYQLKMRSYYVLQDTTALDRATEQAIAAMKSNGQIYLEAGLIYSGLNAFARAESLLITAMSLEANPAETDDDAFQHGPAGQELTNRVRAKAAYQLGYIYGIQGDFGRSLAMSYRALALDTTMIEAYINLANAFQSSGQIDSVDNIIRIAHRRFPGHRLLQSLPRIGP